MSQPVFPVTSADLPMNGSELELIRWLFRFTDWTRPQTIRAIAMATGAQLRQPGAIAGGHGDGSILAAYAHLVGAEDHWLSRWMGPLREPDPDEPNDATFESVSLRWERLSGARAAWLAGLTSADLTAPFMELTGADGVVAVAPLWPALVHVVNHTAHHRSEIYEALTRFGIPPTEEPDLIDYSGEELGARSPFTIRFLDQSTG